MGHRIPALVAGIGAQVETVGAGAQVIAVETALAAYVAPCGVYALEPQLILHGAVLPWLYDAILKGERTGLVVAQRDGVGVVDVAAQGGVVATGRHCLAVNGQLREVDGQGSSRPGVLAATGERHQSVDGAEVQVSVVSEQCR